MHDAIEEGIYIYGDANNPMDIQNFLLWGRYLPAIAGCLLISGVPLMVQEY